MVYRNCKKQDFDVMDFSLVALFVISCHVCGNSIVSNGVFPVQPGKNPERPGELLDLHLAEQVRDIGLCNFLMKTIYDL